MTEMPAHVPFGEQLQLAPQQRLIVTGQRLRDRAALKCDQRLDGIGEQSVGIGLVDHVKIGMPPEIIEQQEAVLQIARQHHRHVDACVREQPGDLHEGPAVFLRWRCIHHDQAVHAVRPTEIATKTGVAAGRAQLADRDLAPVTLSENGR